jgi:hypothetical protein
MALAQMAMAFVGFWASLLAAGWLSLKTGIDPYILWFFTMFGLAIVGLLIAGLVRRLRA